MTARLLSPQQMGQATQLRQEGYSIRDIAHELNVPKCRIEWFLKAQKLDALPQQQPLLSRSSHDVVTTREHARQLEELASCEQALTQGSMPLEDPIAQRHRLLQAMPQPQEQYETFRKRARQEKLVNRYNRLLQEVLDNCDDCRWSGDDVDDLLERAEAIKDKVVAYCDANHIDERRLLIYQGLVFLISDIEDEQRNQTSGVFASSSVDFDFGPNHQATYKSYLVTAFEQLAPLADTPVMDTDGKPVSADDEDNDWEQDD